MNSEVDILSLGGSGGFGMNALLFRCGETSLLIDYGIGFPHEGLPGIERLVPDPSPILNRVPSIDGILLTHGHDDHVGGLPFLPAPWRDAPMYGTPLTLAFASDRFSNARSLAPDFREVDPGAAVSCGQLRVRFIPVTHSIPQSCALAIETPQGSFIHSGDFKLDPSPMVGQSTDLAALEQEGLRGVRLLLLDSTGARRSGRTLSELDLVPGLAEIVEDAHAQVFVSTFSSQLHRIQTLLHIARRTGRRVALLGRRIQRSVELARSAGLLEAPPGILGSAAEVSRRPADKRMYIVAGCQGELTSSLSRLSFGNDARAHVESGDTVVISASVIPGNGLLVARLLDRFHRLGARVLHADDRAGIHASGHGSREELMEMIQILRPRAVLPIHGDLAHLHAAAELASSQVEGSDLIAERGDWLTVTPKTITVRETVSLSPLHVDAADRIVPEQVIRERSRMAAGGVAVVRVCRSRPDSGSSSDELILEASARGIPGWRGPEGLQSQVLRASRVALDTLPTSASSDAIREALSSSVRPLMRAASNQRQPEIVVLTPRSREE